MTATIKKQNTGKMKWIALPGTYKITRVEETPVRVLYLSERGGDHDGIRITGYAGDIPVVTVAISGSHSMTLANYRESMARKIQDKGGSWLGRSHATEDAESDARTARMYDPAVTPSATDRKALRDSYYGSSQYRPSSY